MKLMRNGEELLLLCTNNALVSWKTTDARGSVTTNYREKGALMLFRSRDGGIVWSGPQFLDPPPWASNWANIGQVDFMSIDGQLHAVINSIGRLHAVAIVDTGWGARRLLRVPARVGVDVLSPEPADSPHTETRLLTGWVSHAMVHVAHGALRDDSLVVDSTTIAAQKGLRPDEMRLVRCGRSTAIVGTYRSGIFVGQMAGR